MAPRSREGRLKKKAAKRASPDGKRDPSHEKVKPDPAPEPEPEPMSNEEPTEEPVDQLIQWHPELVTLQIQNIRDEWENSDYSHPGSRFDLFSRETAKEVRSAMQFTAERKKHLALKLKGEDNSNYSFTQDTLRKDLCLRDVYERRKSEATDEQYCKGCGYSLLQFEETPYSWVCGHYYCRLCLAKLYRASIKNAVSYPPRCCNIALPTRPDPVLLPLLDNLLEPDESSHWFRKAEEHEDWEPLYCHIPACRAYIPSYNRDLENGVGYCGDWDEDEQMLLDLAAQNGWMQCYQCRRMLEKVEGDCVYAKRFPAIAVGSDITQKLMRRSMSVIKLLAWEQPGKE
ncbi:hypothetical protein BJ508DRAFT_324768 [Ascobolus immersus RN42]|uniref:RING-type domain-containing protein n=1 Tax=Ascobolus immersus RN42 TaxID=1160509 RepID=A0A3N4IAT1_ASCIM|nr:hypothetical protein BJ508DRAFT_324768 [Ascobolus immersus RN42]